MYQIIFDRYCLISGLFSTSLKFINFMENEKRTFSIRKPGFWQHDSYCEFPPHHIFIIFLKKKSDSKIYINRTYIKPDTDQGHL